MGIFNYQRGVQLQTTSVPFSIFAWLITSHKMHLHEQTKKGETNTTTKMHHASVIA